MSLDEAIARMKWAEQEREVKRKKMERLTLDLLAFDSTDLGNAVKCCISEEKYTNKLTDAAYEAFAVIAEIQVLELEC